MSLDLNNAEPMYVLGRAWAICEAAIHEDNGVVVGSIVNQLHIDPLAGFGRLHGRFMLHIKALPSDRKEYWQNALGEVLEMLPGTELPLSPVVIERQGALALGYYHQRVALEG